MRIPGQSIFPPRRDYHRRRHSGLALRSAAGFTLIELLVVLAIIAIIAGISIPALRSVQGGYNLDSTGQAVAAQINLARQNALASSHPVRVCFFQVADYSGTGTVYRAIQCFQEGDNANSPLTGVTKPFFFPAPVKIFTGQANGTDASSLLDVAYSGIIASSNNTYNPYNQTINLPPPYGSSSYTFFRIRSNGQVDQSTTGTTAWSNGWLTLGLETAPIMTNGLPANYVTLQLNAITGIVKVYRP